MSAIESCLLVEVESIRILAFHVAWMKSELRRLERTLPKRCGMTMKRARYLSVRGALE